MAVSNGASIGVLDHLARAGAAVFARDADQRIVFWSRKCEQMLGKPARSVLGRRCYEVTGGRDKFGNVYCHRGCPIVLQARNESDPVRKFPLRIETKRRAKWFDVGTFLIPSNHPSVSTLVHVLRPGKPSAPGASAGTDSAAPSSVREPLRPLRLEGDHVAVLTTREKDTLTLLARGMTTPRIAEELLISPVTVRNHIAAVLQKLNVHSKFAAVALAYQRHLV